MNAYIVSIHSPARYLSEHRLFLFFLFLSHSLSICSRGERINFIANHLFLFISPISCVFNVFLVSFLILLFAMFLRCLSAHHLASLIKQLCAQCVYLCSLHRRALHLYCICRAVVCVCVCVHLVARTLSNRRRHLHHHHHHQHRS